jgi:hypothetical protein
VKPVRIAKPIDPVKYMRPQETTQAAKLEETRRRGGGEGEERGRRRGGEGEERGRRGGGEGEERGRRGGEGRRGENGIC